MTPPPTACRHTVSGSLSPASRRAFHLSLTVLVRYRSQARISPWQMVLPASTRISRVPAYSGSKPRSPQPLRLRDSHPLRSAFPDGSASGSGDPADRQIRPAPSSNPTRATAAAFYAPMVWAPPRSLAATGGITCCFLFLRVLRCFSSPGSLPKAYEFSPRMTALSDDRVAPFGHPRINACVRLPAAFRS